jgi:hypothetical protein
MFQIFATQFEGVYKPFQETQNRQKHHVPLKRILMLEKVQIVCLLRN